eukprot:TRINITY_DN60831_c0_g1_i1.p1 TRINITY_DN60831_c0_g1~~TRINITY_DN60831_c0_g1_i1.p1  ORF type:complete len:320 (+),score=60.10 TRINITY_DN60831_c0_g1_i1:49-960(+)
MARRRQDCRGGDAFLAAVACVAGVLMLCLGRTASSLGFLAAQGRRAEVTAASSVLQAAVASAQSSEFAAVGASASKTHAGSSWQLLGAIAFLAVASKARSKGASARHSSPRSSHVVLSYAPNASLAKPQPLARQEVTAASLVRSTALATSQMPVSYKEAVHDTVIGISKGQVTILAGLTLPVAEQTRRSSRAPARRIGRGRFCNCYSGKGSSTPKNAQRQRSQRRAVGARLADRPMAPFKVEPSFDPSTVPVKKQAGMLLERACHVRRPREPKALSMLEAVTFTRTSHLLWTRSSMTETSEDE